MTNFEARLPFELRSQIFLYCLPVHGRVRPDPATAPLLLAQVSKQWRVVALATPRLWSSIFFEFSSHSPVELPVHPTTALVELWFSRSSDYPLSITLHCPEASKASLPLGLMDVLSKRCDRWERLEVLLPYKDMEELMRVPGPFSSLRILAMDCNEVTYNAYFLMSDIYYLKHQLFSLSPNLASLRLRRSVVDPLPQEVASTPMTTLQFAGGPSASAAVLCSFPRLRNLIVHHSYDSNHSSPPPTALSMVVATQLRYLFLYDAIDLPVFVSLPALEHLTVCVSRIDTIDIVVALVKRSGCVLHHLTLFNCHVRSEAWAALLPVTDTLPTLELINVEFESDSQGVCLFPPDLPLSCLRTLIITMCASDCARRVGIYTEFLQILSSRPSLHRAHFEILPDMWYTDPPQPNDFGSELGRVAAPGMHITVESSTHTCSWPPGFESRSDMSCDQSIRRLDYNVFAPHKRLPFCDW